MLAVTRIALTEVFVDLQKPLLCRRAFEECRGYFAPAKKTECRDFHAAIAERGGEVLESDPLCGVGVDSDGEEDVRQHFCHTRLANERHPLCGGFRGYGVVVIPVFIAQSGAKFRDVIGYAVVA